MLYSIRYISVPLGLLLAIVFSCWLGVSNALAQQKKESQPMIAPLPIYFILLDGISYTMIQELRQEGYFQQFNEPTLTISTFPSDTNIALTGIFQHIDPRKAPGYESKFFSRKENKIIGGTVKEYNLIEFPFRNQFDFFHHNLIPRSLLYLFPSTMAKKDFDSIKAEILENPSNEYYFSTINSFDGVNHLQGKKDSSEICKYINDGVTQLIQQYQDRYGKTPHLVIFSDHGFHFERLKIYGLNDFSKVLKKAGFRLTNHLEAPNDIVIVGYGTVSAGAGFLKHPILDPALIEQAALAIIQANGMDLVFYRISSSKIGVFAKHNGIESAILHFDSNKNRYRYEAINGDPLKLKEIIKGMTEKFGLPKDDFFPEELWLESTYYHTYPNPFLRVFDAFNNLVENPADLMFSMKESTSYGGPGARAGCFVKGGSKGSHGALAYDSSEAFVMSNYLQGLPPAISYKDLLQHFITRPKVK